VLVVGRAVSAATDRGAAARLVHESVKGALGSVRV